MIAWKQNCRGKYDSFLSGVAYFANSRRRQGIQLSRDGLKRDVSIVHLTMDNNSRPCDAVKVIPVVIIVAVVVLPDCHCNGRILLTCFIEDFNRKHGVDFPLRHDRLCDF
jgi:hypothetical protein